jgi:hypothetical protein
MPSVMVARVDQYARYGVREAVRSRGGKARSKAGAAGLQIFFYRDCGWGLGNGRVGTRFGTCFAIAIQFCFVSWLIGAFTSIRVDSTYFALFRFSVIPLRFGGVNAPNVENLFIEVRLFRCYIPTHLYPTLLRSLMIVAFLQMRHQR